MVDFRFDFTTSEVITIEGALRTEMADCAKLIDSLNLETSNLPYSTIKSLFETRMEAEALYERFKNTHGEYSGDLEALARDALRAFE